MYKHQLACMETLVIANINHLELSEDFEEKTTRKLQYIYEKIKNLEEDYIKKLKLILSLATLNIFLEVKIIGFTFDQENENNKQ